MDCSFYGVDVSKEKLDIYCNGRSYVIANTKGEIKSFVKKMPAGSFIAMEATNVFHMELADWCHRCGMRVFVINPRVTRHYREVQSVRGHTDRLDARTIAKFIISEHGNLREYVPKTAEQRKLQTLIRRRSKLTGIKAQIRLSMKGVSSIKRELDDLYARIDRLVARMDMLIDKILASDEDRKRIIGIKGVGPVVSAALVSDLQSHKFVSSDAYVAFCGLDPRPNQSGKFCGRRKLSKQGSKLSRSLLYTAAMAATKSKIWKPTYEALQKRGLTKIQAIVCIARKIARTAWSIYTYKTTFNPARITNAV